MDAADLTARQPLAPVILCGGRGTRLWPVSRADQPKPFHRLGQPHSLLQQTALRLRGAGTPAGDAAIVVANEEHRFIAAQQLADVQAPAGALILEPQGRGTAAALTLAALWLAECGQEQAVMLVTPADHAIADPQGWWQAVTRGRAAAEAGAVVLFGVPPQRAETGYGYIHADWAADAGGVGAARPVIGFVEKPGAAQAAGLIAAPHHYWNSGMGLLRADVWLQAVARFLPATLQACRDAMQQRREDGDFVRPDPQAFLRCPTQSLDRGVLEPLAREQPRCNALLMCELACGWSDVGAWDAVWQQAPRDADGNAALGPHALLDCRNTLALSSGRLLAMVGVQDLMVVETSDAVLVAHRSAVQQVAAVVHQLDEEGRDQGRCSQSGAPRPWGWFDVIGRGPNWLVKRLVVRPGASLSLQRHRHRSEHWVVVRGTAQVWRDGRQLEVLTYASTFVPQGAVHRLSNGGAQLLEVIEVQTGDILSEDDIERLDDAYGRTDAMLAAAS